MNLYFACAGAASTAITLIHVIAGGPEIIAPVRAAASLSPVVRNMNYYCWHLVTINLVLLAGLFFWAAASPAAWQLGVVATGAVAAYGMWSVALVLSAKQRFLDMPQAILFLPVAALGLLGAVQ